MHSSKTQAQHKRQERQRIFIGETIKEKTHNFLRDRISTESKTQKHKDDLPIVVVSLSDTSNFSSHSCAPMSECVFDK